MAVPSALRREDVGPVREARHETDGYDGLGYPLVASRRARHGRKAAMRWVKTLLGPAAARPAKLPRRPTASSERPRAPVQATDPALEELRQELLERIVDHTDERAPHALRHLVLVHDELGRTGWRGVEGFPVRVVAKARVQAEMLSSLEASPAFRAFIERLRLVEVAARLREEEANGEGPPRRELPEEFPDSEVEVSQGSHEEYEILERSWIGTVPAGLDRPIPRN